MAESEAVNEFSKKLQWVHSVAAGRLERLFETSPTLRKGVADAICVAMADMHVLSGIKDRFPNVGLLVCHNAMIVITERVLEALQQEDKDAAGH